MKLSIIIATLGRRQVLARTLLDLQRQNRMPDEVLLIGAYEADLPIESLPSLTYPVRTLISKVGSTWQRNAGIDVASESDMIVFLDDDFLMAPDYLANAEKLFLSQPDVVVATGNVVADGIHGPGIPFELGQSQVSALPVMQDLPTTPVYNGYGCNMIVRTAPVIRHNLRFDTRLPLYAWLEDVDFSRQLAGYGQIVRCEALRGVHLGTKLGRGSGRRFGYSQIANPLYLRQKKTMMGRRAFAMMARNVTANLVKSLRPEPEIDRRGRLLGNLLAFSHLLSGGLRPERVQDLK